MDRIRYGVAMDVESAMEEVSELIYLRQRSLQEFQMAQMASSPGVAKPHYSIAIAYQEKADQLKRRLAGSTAVSVE